MMVVPLILITLKVPNPEELALAKLAQTVSELP